MDARSHHPDRTYPHLAPGPDLTLVDVGPDFWETIDDRPELHTGRLVTSFEMNADWTSGRCIRPATNSSS